ncbi:MAG: PQQ-binding-like beta-propeller repeat protein [Armatimonadetes bacterium]|nr:PQQ-binding-like beta-propeller repeat protein [Armatimonadota bacterium]
MRRAITLAVFALTVAVLVACRNSSTVADTGAAGNGAVADGVAAGDVGDWPQFRGPNANGISPETGINKAWPSNTPRTLWNVPLTDNGYAGPSVANGKVYIIDHQGNQDIVRALDLLTGKEEWRYGYQDTDRANGGFARATPVIDHHKVYTLSRLGMAHCLDAQTGELLWARDIVADFQGKRPTWDFSMSPLIDGNKVILCPGGPNAAVVALDKSSGETIWQGGGSEMPGYATPVVANIGGTKQYVVFVAKSVIGVDAASGKLLWSCPWVTNVDVNAATPLVIGNSVFITSGYGHGCALVDVSGDSARARWGNKEIQAHFSSPIFWDGYIYGNSDPGNLVCLDANTGKAMWKQPGFERGPIVAVDGMIIGFNGANGELVMARLSPAGYQELGRITPLGGQSWTAPIIASGKLIVRNRNAIACLDLK